MKGIPKSTSAFLDDIVKPFPRTPHACAKAILKFVCDNYDYGCDENVEQEKWARYPDEVKKYMTCQEYGIFMFLLSKQAGLDAIVLNLEDYDGTDQSHLMTLIQGKNKSYLLSVGELQAVKSFSDKKILVQNRNEKKEPEEISFSKMTLLSEPEVISLIDSFKGREGFRNFFGKGQLLSDYYVQEKKRNLIFRTSRFIKVQDDNMTLRKSLEFLGYAFNIFFSRKDAISGIFSSGVNNSVIKNPICFFESKEGEKAKYIDIEEQYRERLINVWFRNQFAGLIIKSRYNARTRKKLSSEELGIYSSRKQQLLERLFFIGRYTTKRISEAFLDECRKENDHKPTEYTHRDIIITDYHQAQAADQRSYFSKKQHILLEKLDSLAKKHRLDTYDVR